MSSLDNGGRIDDPGSPAPAVELCQLSVKECFVYQVPPLKTASGHRAEEWGLEKPLLTGHLKVFQSDDRLRVVLYRYLDTASLSAGPDNLAAFAECPIQVRPGEAITPFVDGVIDSSRYFVLRIQDPNRPQRTMMLGIGFRERDTALDFKQTLNDYVRFVDRMAAAAAYAASGLSGVEVAAEASGDEKGGEGSSSSALSLSLAPPSRDLALKEGQKIHINVKPRAAHSGGQGDEASSSSSQPPHGPAAGQQARPAAAGGSGGFLLRPPPPPGSIVGASSVSASRLAPPPPPAAAVASGPSSAQPPVQSADEDEEEWRGPIPALGPLAQPTEGGHGRSNVRFSSITRTPQDAAGTSSSRGILAPLVVRGDPRTCPSEPLPSSSSVSAALILSPPKARPMPGSTMPIEIPTHKPVIDTQVSNSELGSIIENFYPHLSPDSVASQLDGRKGSSLLARLEEERLRIQQRQQPLPPDARARLLDAAASMDVESVADSLFRDAELRERESRGPYLGLASSPPKKEPLDDLPQVAVSRRLACQEEALHMRDRALRAANTGGAPPPLSPKPSSMCTRRTAQSPVRRMSTMGGIEASSAAAPPQPFRERSYTDPMPTRASREVPPPRKQCEGVTRFVSNYLSDLLSDQSDSSEDGRRNGRMRVVSDSDIDVQPPPWDQARPRLLPLIGSEPLMPKLSLPLLSLSAGIHSEIDEKVMELLAQAARGTQRRARGSMSPPSSSDHSSKGWSTSLSSGVSYDSSLLAIDLPAIDRGRGASLDVECTSPLTTDRSGSATSRQTLPEDLDADVLLHCEAQRLSAPGQVPRPTARVLLRANARLAPPQPEAPLSVVGTNPQHAAK